MTTTDISVLNLSTRTFNCLKRANILTIEDLCQQTPESLRLIKFIGETSLKEIQEALIKQGKSLGRKVCKQNSQDLIDFLEKDLLDRRLENSENYLLEVLEYLWEVKPEKARKLERALSSLVKNLKEI